MIGLGNISGWQPAEGPVTTWMASPAAREAARAARRSDIPPTYQRAQHLRKAYDGAPARFPRRPAQRRIRSTPPSILLACRLTGYWSWRHQLNLRSSRPHVHQ